MIGAKQGAGSGVLCTVCKLGGDEEVARNAVTRLEIRAMGL